MPFVKICLFIILHLAFFFSLSFAQTTETIQIDTYYPAPYGVYAELTTTSNTYLATEGGNVGIGTTAPNPFSKLHIESNSDYPLYIHGNINAGIGPYIYNEGGTAEINMVSNDNDWRIRAAGSGTPNPGELLFQDVSSGTNAMVIVDGNNRVGIGTDDPQAKLDVNGGVLIQGQHPITRIDTGFYSKPGCGSWTDTQDLGFQIVGAIAYVHQEGWASDWRASTPRATWSGSILTLQTDVAG